MHADRPIVEGPYLGDILEQPAALCATADWLAGEQRWLAAGRFLAQRSWRRIVLTGMGSSFHSLHPLNLALIAHGQTPVMMETSELLNYGMSLCDEDTLLIAVSQSGASVETCRLLEANRRSPVLGITNTADSPLARRAGLALFAQAGPEHSVSCKTYVCGLLVLQWLGGIVAGDAEADVNRALAPAADLFGAYLGRWRAHTQYLVQRMTGVRHLFLTGRGNSMAAVGTGALIIKEATHVHAEGMSSAAFRHGPLEMLHPDVQVLVYTGVARTRELNARLVADIRALGTGCALIGTEGEGAFALPGCPPALQPLVDILPAQMLTLALAALAGREAGRFERASKITVVE